MEKDPIYEAVAKYVSTLDNVKKYNLQVKYHLGYMRADRILSQLEHYNVISKIDNFGNYKVLTPNTNVVKQ